VSRGGRDAARSPHTGQVLGLVTGQASSTSGPSEDEPHRPYHQAARVPLPRARSPAAPQSQRVSMTVTRANLAAGSDARGPRAPGAVESTGAAGVLRC
jgi:hypothetical protein